MNQLDPLDQSGQYFATVARGLESLAAQELESLGAEAVTLGFCGVSFRGDRSLLYRVNLWARLPFRILMQIHQFPCLDAQALYRGIQAIKWEQYLTPKHSLAVSATGGNSQLNHTHFTALQVKNAIVDQQQRVWGDRSPVDTQEPDLRINVFIDKEDLCTVSLDSSGTSLHRRGYRPAVGQAPLKESLAAALVQLAGWSTDLPFLDPLCGSGTLPLEAALQALDMAPGLFRERFGFETWTDFDATLFDRLLEEASTRQKFLLPAPILGSDADSRVIKQAITNAENCGVDRQVQFTCTELAHLEAPAAQGVLVCNPPYGERIGRDQELSGLYKLLGDVMKRRFKGWTAFVLSGNRELTKAIGLKPSQQTQIFNGSLPCQFLKYELY
ncbi:MAG: RNA methyltransferase [Coleofasciculaceae cyanobacterium SM2_1_6]|nr:RNA methyltransferase [Coleofasciculaceae cyanobacterium SM2_1_6]